MKEEIEQPRIEEEKIIAEPPVEETIVEEPIVNEPAVEQLVEEIKSVEEVKQPEVNEEVKEEVKEEAKEEVKEEAKEEEAEQTATESRSKRINIVLRDMCNRRVYEPNIAVATREELKKIFRNPSYNDKQLLTGVNIANDIPQSMARQFENARYDLITPQGVERMTMTVFRDALYSTEECGFDLVTRIGMAQRITDLMMKDYSLAAFVPTEFGKYADNYIVLNKGILKNLIKDQTNDLSENEISDLMNKVDREMAAELSGWYSRDVERRLDTLVMPYEEIYQKIMGDTAPELNEVSMEKFRGFEAEYKKNLEKPELTEKVKAEIAKIYAEAGVKESKLDAAADKAFNDLVGLMTETYGDLHRHPEYLKTAKDMMSYIAEVTLYYAASGAYDYVGDMSERLVVSQHIADVFLRNYSPAAFVNGDYDKFADNYVTYSNDRLESWMRSYYYGNDIQHRANIVKGIEKLMNRAMDDAAEEEIYNVPAEEMDDDDDIGEEAEEEKVEEKHEEKYERKEVEKYERRVDGIQLPENRMLSEADIKFFRDECNNSIADPALTEYVKAQIGAILDDGGVDNSKILKTVDNIFNKCLGNKGMLAFYDKTNSLNVYNSSSEAMMSKMVKYSTNFVTSATDGCFASLEEGLVVNQKILDVLLKNYSPVAFAKDDLGKYADNYVLDSEVMLANYYKEFVNRNANGKEMEDFVERVRAARGDVKSSEIADESAVKEDNRLDREKIVVDDSKVEAVKAEETKVESPVVEVAKNKESNPFRESMVIESLSEKVAAKEVSSKVKENDTPVASNAKK